MRQKPAIKRNRAHARDPVALRACRGARVKPRPIVYGPAFGRWIRSHIIRDLRNGTLRVNAEGATLH